jgi:SAM-dependent methyltransferase
MYDEVITNLRESYNQKAVERDQYPVSDWKVEERAHFLSLLQAEGKQHLLEIGAGPGRDSKFFQDNGLEVVCTDLSPEMVAICQSKGLTAYVMDFLSLDFPDGSFDAVYALNCLLHVPKSDLKKVLGNIQRILKPSGLFYLGVYGGHDYEGVWPEDNYTPKRFFSFHTDDAIKAVVSEFFDLRYFKPVPVDGETVRHFQSMILQRL